ncbi:FecR family protein [Arenibacter sp. ARW7G5Y1]|uniref:FecR family protein n=1 Tax=Arenibacter sp. ARW7G5Y1 TaxID=2135619 RepID=UPI000D7701AE|nr:FecR family protein [Arenibacter sp. ARW7G5Y1]PXX23767.1 FecR family protein [Arenibacter sp. ARW7G5Y1]PXX23774.1 FecR family protein [Arenibacter sp. ARW7G5Y1]
MTNGIYDEERAKASILRRIKKERSIFRDRSKMAKSLKYAAVAAMAAVVLTTTLFFKDVLTTTPLKSDPVHVNSNIKPGTDRATLILEDGTSVVLEKGSSFQKQNINSNGERVVYEPLEKDVNETEYNILNVPRGGQFYLKLSDGTEVWLNSETQLKYPVAFLEGETRKVELVYGEAYFNVTPSTAHQGAKFEVLNNGQQLEVLGTKFNIKAYKDESNIYTTLVEGSVQINTSNVKKVLVPNQQSSVNIFNNEIYVEHVDVENEISWIKGIFSFKGKSLKDIMKVLSRWYDVDIVFENNDMEEVRFRGTLDKGQAIGEILSIMKSNTINNYEIKGGTIIIK